MEEKVSKFQEELALKIDELTCLTEQLESSKKVNSKLLEEIGRLEEYSKKMEEKLTSKIFLSQKLATSNEKLGNECKELASQLSQLNSELAWERKQREQAERELNQLRKSLELEKTQHLAIIRVQEEDKETVVKKSTALTTENGSLKKKLKDLTQYLQMSDSKKSKLEQKLLKLQESHRLELQNQQQIFESQIEELQREIFKLKFAQNHQLTQVISIHSSPNLEKFHKSKRVLILLDPLMSVSSRSTQFGL